MQQRCHTLRRPESSADCGSAGRQGNQHLARSWPLPLPGPIGQLVTAAYHNPHVTTEQQQKHIWRWCSLHKLCVCWVSMVEIKLQALKRRHSANLESVQQGLARALT
jgi:hypothetical protein